MLARKAWLELFLSLFTLWILFTLDFTFWNFIIGAVICAIITYISFDIFYDNLKSAIRIPNIIILCKYFIILVWEIYKSSFINIMRIIKKDHDITIVEVELKVKEPLLIIIISNSITLTPGTITIDWNKNKLYVLAMKDDGLNGEKIKGDIKEKFEKHFI